MNKVINFENLELGAKIRVVENGQGEPLWVAKDVAEALGYTWKGSSGTISHVPEEWKGIWTVQIPLGSQEMAVLTEQGLYFFLGRSDSILNRADVRGGRLPGQKRTKSRRKK